MYQYLIKRAKTLLPLLPTSTKRHFSFLLMRKKVLAVGWDKSRKSHPLGNKYGTRFNNIHSELDCILNFEYPPYNLRSLTMVNIRLLKSGLPAMAKPCPSCQKMLADFGISEVYYTNRKGEFARL